MPAKITVSLPFSKREHSTQHSASPWITLYLWVVHPCPSHATLNFCSLTFLIFIPIFLMATAGIKCHKIDRLKTTGNGASCGPVVKNLLANAGDIGSSPAWGRFLTCYRVTKPMCQNYWDSLLEAVLCNKEATSLRSQCTAREQTPRATRCN